MSDSRVYFPNLNGVRFLAALVVIIHHVEMGKFWLGQPNIYDKSFVGGVFGQLGIIMFFVLSGFLITYLLLEEHRKTGTISIKDFYIRRMLRIWPVYYLIVILGFFVFPQISFLDIPGFSEFMSEDFWLKAGMYFSFLPNLGYVLYEHIPYATQTWSVGVEEQFYLMWPLLMLWGIKKNRVPHVLTGTIILYLMIKVSAVTNYAQDLNDVSAMRAWLFIDHFSIDAMAMGGIGAYLLFNKEEKWLKPLFNKYLQFFLYVLLGILTVKGWVLPWFNKELFAVIFAVLILNLAANKKSLINLEFRPLNYLGKISYGLYMYHNLVLIVILKVVIMYQLFDLGSIDGAVFYQVLSTCVTIAVSAASYEYFEKRFLLLKDRFTKVKSGHNLDEKRTPPGPELYESGNVSTQSV